MSFQDRVLGAVKRIPKGRVASYKGVAEAVGSRAYRAVGNALHNNKNPVVVPCHRVVNSDGSLGGYAHGIKKKIELLEKEGVKIKKGKVADFDKRLFRL